MLALGSLASIVEAGHYNWTTAGPEPGLVEQVVVNPADSDRMLAVVGYYSQLLFETTDRGTTWVQVEGVNYVSRLSQDPSNAGVLYTIGASPAFFGVIKSHDAGRTWSPSSTGLPITTSFPAAVALSPSNPQTLYVLVAGSPGQVYRSVDGAATWAPVSAAFPANWVGDAAVDPGDPSVIYAVGSPAGVYKSTDAGATWAPAGSLPSAQRILIDPATPSTLYAGTGDTGVWKSTDGGASWLPSNVGIEADWVRDLAFDPTNSGKLWIGGGSTGSTPGGAHVSSDGGQTWTLVDLGAPATIATAVAVDPRNSALVYVAGAQSVLRGGLYASADGGASWTPRASGLSGYYSYAVACDGSQAGSAYGVSGAKVFHTDDGGASWALRGTSPFGLIALVGDPSSPQTLYGDYLSGGAAGVVKSVDGGATWNPASSGITAINMYGLAISPSAPDHLLAAAYEGLFGTTDGGGLWTPLLAGEMRSGAFDPEDSSILYAGLWSGSPVGVGLLRSADGGASWNPPSGLPTTYPHVLDILAPKEDPTRVYAAFGQGVYRSTDRGLSFAAANTGLSGGFWPTRLASDPSDAATLYAVGQPSPAAAPAPQAAVAAAPNLFRTRNGADSWAPLPGFLPGGYSTLDFGVGADGRTLYASTLSGIFQFVRSFVDVPDGDLFWTSVDAAAMNGVSSGCGAGRFCPSSPTSRASVAVFLLRGLHGPLFAPPPATGAVFGDVDAGSAAADFIEELGNEGITAGCGGGNYCPGAALSRAEMAVLLLKTEHGADYAPPPATGAVFTDVPADAFAAAWIEQLYAEGISAGCGQGAFCPSAPLSRAQAAALVVRAFGLS